MALGTPGLPERPLIAGARVTAAGLLLLDISEAEGTPGLWLSRDMNTWSPCDAGAWSLAGNTLTIDLAHPSLAGAERCFFRVSVAE